MYSTVNWELLGQIAILQFCNSPGNSVNQQFLQDLRQCLTEMERVEKIRAMVVMSTLEIIFATSDLEQGEEAKDECPPNNILLFDVIKKIHSQSFPSFAIVSGFALGNGFELALACDYRIATKSARFGYLSGTSPTKMGEDAINKMIGDTKAKEISLFGQIIGGIEAKRIGMVDRIISAPPLMSNMSEVENLVITQLGNAFLA
ncbi:enoyl-CoA hydratase/isomerase family protein [Neobacillus drentensis]|uniref:enoyl-CoA hydratase/isomerase family protein n=1 Tax=Neobacillus drentensis TaxID=220684 RepID=UPI002FFF75A7